MLRVSEEMVRIANDKVRVGLKPGQGCWAATVNFKNMPYMFDSFIYGRVSNADA